MVLTDVFATCAILLARQWSSTVLRVNTSTSFRFPLQLEILHPIFGLNLLRVKVI